MCRCSNYGRPGRAREPWPTLDASSTLVPGTFWSGLVDEVHIYTRAVKPQQLTHSAKIEWPAA